LEDTSASGSRIARVANILLASALIAAFASLWFAAPQRGFRLDERDYLREAVHVARDGVFSDAPVAETATRGGAYREPAYAWLLAVSWRLAGATIPVDEEGWAQGAEPAAARVAQRLGALLLAAAAAAAALAARGAGASSATAAAGALAVLLSPALRAASEAPGSEVLTATLIAAAVAFWIAALRSASILPLLAAGGLAGLAPLARGAAFVLLPVGAAILLLGPTDVPARVRRRRALVFALLAALPATVWCARNRAVTGHFALAERGGQVLWTRAELDLQLGQEGLLPALLEWTPLESARALGRSLAPDSRLDAYRWRGPGNFFTRSIRRWHAEREADGDPFVAEARLTAAALGVFARHPWDHLRATVAVAWRGLFAERSPAWLEPVDLTFALGLLLAAVFAWRLLAALRSRRPVELALVATPLAFFLFHALATEFLPRFGLPLLPLVWVVAVGAFSSSAARGRPAGGGEAARPAAPGA
jgi:4-amino-4-deoxy-L-arabinose transferase-like glycosyltransferase